MADDMNFKAWLARNNITQREVASVLDISENALRVKLNGNGNFTLPQIRKLHEKYGVSADIFLVK